MDKTKERTLYPRKLFPPPEVIKKMQERKKNAVSSNTYIRLFKQFFGEGF